MTGQIIGALHAAAFSQADDTNALLVCSSIFAGRVTGRGTPIASVSATTEETHRYSSPTNQSGPRDTPFPCFLGRHRWTGFRIEE